MVQDVKRELFTPDDPQKFYQLLQDNINNALTGILTEQNKTEILEDLDLETDYSNLVEHKLGRIISNYHIIKKSTPATIYRKTDSDADLSLYLPLVANMNCVVSLLVW